MPLQLKLTLNEKDNLISLETNSKDLQDWILTEYQGLLFENNIKIEKDIFGEKNYKFQGIIPEKLLSSLKEYSNTELYENLKINLKNIYHGKTN